MVKRLKETNFSEAEIAKLLEKVSLRKTLIMSSFQKNIARKI